MTGVFHWHYRACGPDENLWALMKEGVFAYRGEEQVPIMSARAGDALMRISDKPIDGWRQLDRVSDAFNLASE